MFTTRKRIRRKKARSIGSATKAFEIIRARPALVADLLRSVDKILAKRISEISRYIRDGEW